MKSKDIKGFLVDEKYVEANTQLRGGEERVTSWNNCLRQQGEKSLTLNREKLAKIIQEYFGIIEVESVAQIYKDMEEITRKFVNWSMTHGLADAIISSFPDILECDEK